MKPPAMTDEQIRALAPDTLDEWSVHARAIIAARDKQWQEMLGEPVALTDAQIRFMFDTIAKWAGGPPKAAWKEVIDAAQGVK